MEHLKWDSETKLNTGFTVPEGYFENFSEKMALRMLAEPKQISLWQRSRKRFYALAAILALSLSIPVMDYYRTNFNGQGEVAEMENYLSHHSTLTDDDLIELLSNEDIESLPLKTSVENKDLEEILTANKNLEEYIIN